MIDRCKNLHRGGIATSCPSSSYFAATAATHHSLMMSLPRQRSAMTHLAWRLPCRQLPCRQGRFSSPRQEGIANFFGMWPTYSYLGHNPQQQQKSINASWLEWSTVAAMATHSRRRRIEQSPTMLADCRMRRRQEWGTMAAVGRQQPPWSMGVCFS
jgi:hypothetical protein